VNSCQKKDDPPSKRPALCALLDAHNPVPRNSQPTTRNTHLATRTSQPAPRNAQLAPRNTHLATSLLGHHVRNRLLQPIDGQLKHGKYFSDGTDRAGVVPHACGNGVEPDGMGKGFGDEV
jgi:hypothetical protein